MIYYYNNDSYKGEIHLSLKNTLNYGVLSIFKNKELDKDVNVVATFTKNQTIATKLLKRLNSCNENIQELYQEIGNVYNGSISRSEQSLFLDLENKDNRDKCFIILNNPPTINKYIGGVGTVNSIARGREHNPCVQFIILTKKILDVPEGELYNILAFDKLNINLDSAIKDIIELFKRVYIDKNELSMNLSETQKQAIVKNKLEYYFNEILEANLFRFAKVSNREDDSIYKLIREGIDA